MMEGYCCTKIRLQSDSGPASAVTGDYKIMFNIEDDSMTCNSYIVFSQIKRPATDHYFIYMDRHGNWVVGGYLGLIALSTRVLRISLLGTEVGKARGVLRSSSEDSQYVDCPCLVENWDCWDPDTRETGLES